MKKILVFSLDFPPNTGGIARLTYQIAKELADRGRDVEVLTRDNEKVAFNVTGKESFKITCVSSNNERVRLYRYLKQINNKDEYIVICGLWWPEGLFSILAGFKNTYILTHAAELRSYKKQFWLKRKLWIPFVCKNVLARASKVIANSDYTGKLSQQVSPNANVVSIPLAVDHTVFKPIQFENTDSALFTIITVSRILMFKGFDTILCVLDNLPADIKEKVRWKIAGTGPDKQLLEDMVRKSTISHQVEFVGFVPECDLPEFYAKGDLFVLCTREDDQSSNVEGFGLVFLEAQSSGTPVIGSNQGGIPSAIDHGNGGWLIDSKGELSSLLIKLILDRNYLYEMSHKARHRVEQYCTWQTYIDELIRIF